MGQYREQEYIHDYHLSNVTIRDTEFIECTFKNCEFHRLQCINCRFCDCTFIRCKIIQPEFHICTLSSNTFKECRLIGIVWNGLSAGCLMPIDRLEQCFLRYNQFSDDHYVKFCFSDNDIVESTFADCHLSQSYFCRCSLQNTEFIRCDLQRTNFESAQGYQIDITSCNLKGAIFSFPEVTNLLNRLDIVIR